MKRYPWKWGPAGWFPFCGYFNIGSATDDRGSTVVPRVPPDTARRRLRRRQMETLAALVLTAKRMGKEVR